MGIIYTLYFAPSHVLITGHQGFDQRRGIARTTIANFNAWTYNGISENELK
jgi:D-lactate dehydrogenase